MPKGLIKCFMIAASVAIASPSVGSEAGAEPTLSLTGLLSASQAPRAWRPKDEFDAAPKVALVNRRFAFRQPLRQQSDKTCSGTLSWSYDAGTSTLSFNTTGRLFGGGLGFTLYGSRYPDGVNDYGHESMTVSCARQAHGSYGVMNGFGARSTIWRRSEVITELASEQTFNGMRFAIKSVAMEPAQARLITPNLQLEVEGVLLDWKGGNALMCGLHHVEPDFDDVYETATHTCAYKTRFVRIAVINGLNNEVVSEALVTPR